MFTRNSTTTTARPWARISSIALGTALAIGMTFMTARGASSSDGKGRAVAHGNGIAGTRFMSDNHLGFRFMVHENRDGTITGTGSWDALDLNNVFVAREEYVIHSIAYTTSPDGFPMAVIQGMVTVGYPGQTDSTWETIATVVAGGPNAGMIGNFDFPIAAFGGNELDAATIVFLVEHGFAPPLFNAGNFRTLLTGSVHD